MLAAHRRRRFDDVAALFAADARFVALGVTHEGPPGVKAFLEQYQGPDIRAKHVTTNAIIDVEGDTARAWTDYVYVVRDLTILSAGTTTRSCVATTAAGGSATGASASGGGWPGRR